MKAAGIIVFLACGVASADPTPMIHAPAGWRADAEQATQLASTLHREVSTIAAEAYVPSEPGVVLFATRETTTSPSTPQARGAVENAAITDFHDTVRRARLSSAKVDESAWSTSIQGGTQLVASVTWHDVDVQLVHDARLLLAMDKGHAVTVVAECIARDDAPPAAVHACGDALATLATGIADADALALDPPDGTSTGAAPIAIPEPSTPAGSAATPTAQPSRMSDGSHLKMPPLQVAPDATPTTSDQRPIYIGLGLVVLAIIFYFNRKRREKLAREDANPSKDSDA